MATRNTNIVAPKLIKPIPGNSTNVWGGMLNENFDKLSEFHTKVIADSEMQNQELARLENEKLNIEDIPSKVEPVVQEFLETTIKPQIDDYIDETSKPSLDDYVVVKKGELDQYVTNTSKPSLDTYTGEKKNELNTHTAAKKGELDTYTGTKKTQLDSYTTEKEEELDAHVVVKKGDLDSYTTTKKQEINTFTEEQKGELDTYEKSKESELNVYTGDKKRELDTYEGEKETELNQHTQTKITELSNHTNTKKGELDTYTTQKKGEITTHTDSEIERINADSELANKANKTIQVIAGNGLVGGGDLSTNRTLNIASADDGITVNADNIKLNIVDNTTTDSATRAGSARQIKLLSENKVNKTDIVDDLITADKSKVLSANMGKYLDADKPSKDKAETITNYWTFESKTPFIKFKKTGEQSLPSAGYSAFIGFGSSARPHELQINNLYDDGTVDIKSKDLKTENKNITKAINEVYDSQLGTQGISSIIYIQDTGEKTAGNGYVDKTTGSLYLCKVTTTDTSVTDKFLLATNIENRDRISIIEEKLGIYHPVGKISTISVSRDENSSSPTLSFSSL